MYSVLHSIGFCLVLMLGAVVHWRLAMAVPALLALPTMVGIYHLRESPAWLQRRGSTEETRRAADFYRLPHPEDLQIATGSDIKKQDGLIEKIKSELQQLSKQDSSFWQNFYFLVVLFLLLGWCGFSILSFYAVEVFQLSGSLLSASHTSWVTSLTKIVCAIASFYFLHTFSR